MLLFLELCTAFCYCLHWMYTVDSYCTYICKYAQIDEFYDIGSICS